MTLTIAGDAFHWNGAPTYTAATGWPQADSRLEGLLLNHRAINGIFDDLNPSHDYDGDGRDDWAFPDLRRWDPDENTRRFLAAMPHWREAGVLAFTVGLQAGNPFASSPPPPGLDTRMVDSGAFAPDGSLREAFLARLGRILRRARELQMVPIVNYFYQGAIHRLAEGALEAALEGATRWLLEGDYTDLLIDLVNECGAGAYPPALGPQRVHEAIARVQGLIAAEERRTGEGRRIYVGTSLHPRLSLAERVGELPAALLRTADVLMPHGNNRTTDEVRGCITALRGRLLAERGEERPILYNEDTRPPAAPGADSGGDLAHLSACADLHASWGNLIRSHQRVPCVDWADGSDVQREWFAATRWLAGARRGA